MEINTKNTYKFSKDEVIQALVDYIETVHPNSSPNTDMEVQIEYEPEIDPDDDRNVYNGFCGITLKD